MCHKWLKLDVFPDMPKNLSVIKCVRHIAELVMFARHAMNIGIQNSMGAFKWNDTVHALTVEHDLQCVIL